MKLIGALLMVCGVLSAGDVKHPATSKKAPRAQAVLWRAPNDIATRDLFYGAGGRARQPVGPYRFVADDSSGTNPKFIIKDARGIRWKVKLGPEAQPETAATRLLWAAGYFTDEDYYLPKLRVIGMQKLSRGQKYVNGEVVEGARLERTVEGKKGGTWSWFNNPFIGTKEFGGLRVLVALINDWDLKDVNNRIDVRGNQHRYLIADLGATFGKSGGSWTRSKGDVKDYLDSEFVDEVNRNTVDLKLKNRPPVPYAVNVPYYVQRVKMEKVAEDIPRAHARWIGSWLARLSDKQIGDAFRAGGYEPAEVAAYTQKVRARIRVLNKL